MSNARSFGSIAEFTEQLNVSIRVASTLCEWNYVIELKFRCTTAPHAFPLISLPYEKTNRIRNAFATCHVDAIKVFERFNLAAKSQKTLVVAKYGMLNLELNLIR